MDDVSMAEKSAQQKAGEKKEPGRLTIRGPGLLRYALVRT
jgi:hypothetical protein